MEKEPKKFGREIRKVTTNKEESDLSSVKAFYKLIQLVLKEQKTDLINKKVLEVGSGNAEFINYLKNQGVDVVGVDVRPRGGKESPQVLARIERLPFLDETFEIVYSYQAFDESVYDQDQDQMMKEVFRVLKHGGLYFSNFAENHSTKQMEGFSLVSTPYLTSFRVYQKS